MKARVNTYALNQTVIDSKNLAVLGMVAHQMEKTGSYAGKVYRGRKEVGRFRLTVCDDASAGQADLDLHRYDLDTGRISEPGLRVRTGGYVLVYASEGCGGYRVTLHEPANDKRKPRRIFDSAALSSGDLFVMTPLQPGRYELECGAGKPVRVDVAYPKPTATPYEAPAPEQIELSQKGINARKVSLQASQGLVCTVHSPRSSIALRLVKPNNGGHKRPGPVRWTNPRPSK